MRFPFFFIIFLLSVLRIEAQSFTKFSLGASIHGLITGGINNSTSDKIVTGSQTFSRYADSVKSKETFRTSIGITFWAHAFLTKKWSLQGGIGYLDVGFQRNQTNIQYQDPFFPGIGQGKLQEKSGSEKAIAYNYQYQYLQIPLFAQYEVYSTKDFFYKLSVIGGMGINVLMHHQITANLSQFVVEGKDVFNLDSTGYEGKRIALSFMLGAKGEYRLDKKSIVYVMPVFGFYPMSVSKTLISSHPYYLQLNVGVQYAFNVSDERRK